MMEVGPVVMSQCTFLDLQSIVSLMSCTSLAALPPVLHRAWAWVQAYLAYLLSVQGETHSSLHFAVGSPNAHLQLFPTMPIPSVSSKTPPGKELVQWDGDWEGTAASSAIVSVPSSLVWPRGWMHHVRAPSLS